MKNLKGILPLLAFIGSQEQPMSESFHSFLEQQQQAKSLPIIPTAANVLAPSVTVAGAIKPEATLGAIVTDIDDAKGDEDDRKFFAFQNGTTKLGRVLMFQTDAVNLDVIVGTAELMGTIVRDDHEKETSPHTMTEASGMGAEAIVVAIKDALAAQKPARNMASLINAALDACVDITNDIILVVDQTGDGDVKVYKDAQFDVVTDKEADVSQEVATSTTTVRSRW